jgi:hypothetical protein
MKTVVLPRLPEIHAQTDEPMISKKLPPIATVYADEVIVAVTGCPNLRVSGFNLPKKCDCQYCKAYEIVRQNEADKIRFKSHDPNTCKKYPNCVECGWYT